MNEYEINEQESLSFEEGMRSAEEDQRQAEQRDCLLYTSDAADDW